jgi:hypothetical protein
MVTNIRFNFFYFTMTWENDEELKRNNWINDKIPKTRKGFYAKAVG